MPLLRHPNNPIITRRDIPAISPSLIDVTSVFNPGAIKYLDQYLLLLRVQNRGRETFILKAESSDGIKFRVIPKIIQFEGIEQITEPVYHLYDPRITKLDGSNYVMMAMDMEGRCELGLAQTDDFNSFRFLGIVSDGDVRNGVLFPEKIGGRYLRLDRPNRQSYQSGVTSGDTVWLSESDDLLHWKPVAPVFSGRWHYWDELIGSGPPPVKTKEGWLHIYHGVATHLNSANIYQAGVILLDLHDPSKVIARGKFNILEPRELYEHIGQVPNVVFPSGMIVEQLDQKGFAAMDSEVLVYYGAADTCIGLATTTVNDLLAECHA